MKKTAEELYFDVIVVGGGMSGICAAIASARGGAKTALIQNRPVLGGNASSEVRLHICGGDHHGSHANCRETGILDEILSINKARNPLHSYPIWDGVLYEVCAFEPNLSLFLNTHMTQVETENKKIVSVSACQLTSEREFIFFANLFIDATGDGTLGAKSGALFMYGREDKTAFGEENAPDTADSCTMGSSLMFTARDTGKLVKFIKPKWANTYSEEDLINRNHSGITSGYWWIELGGKDSSTITDAENIRDELLKAIYGVWDHIKNGGEHGADNYELDWMAFLPGKRESRRLLGEYVLCESDCVKPRGFEDSIAYGGWPLDLHVAGGIGTPEESPTKFIYLDDIYPIPYRSIYSKNIDNLFLAGRAISVSHVAFASTRVMGTCAIIGQAAGTAAAICIKEKILPCMLKNHISVLQQQLLKDDCFIPGVINEDSRDLARIAKISSSGCAEGCEPEKVINGVARSQKGNANCYLSPSLNTGEQWIKLKFTQAVKISELHLKFENNLQREQTISISRHVISKQLPVVSPELVKDYRIELYKDGGKVFTKKTCDNIFRFNKTILETPILADSIKIILLGTNYNADYEENKENRAKIFEVRVY